MDKNREILVDLIASKTCFRYSKDCMLRKKRGCSACYCGSCRLGTLVGHLVDNGVRVQNPQAPIKHVVDTEGIRIGNAIWRSGTTVYKCPQCGNFISRLYDYCYKCGQAADWNNVSGTSIADGEDTSVPTKHGEVKGVEIDQFNKWIPASEPPKVYRDEYGIPIPFLAYTEDKSLFITYFVDGKHWGRFGQDLKVTHWMPLPELPKEKK